MDDGEIIDLQQYRQRLEQKEIEDIGSDINQLTSEILQMIDEMESDVGPLLWRQEFIDSAPLLRRFMDKIVEGKKE
jgi:hypothetical protein